MASPASVGVVLRSILIWGAVALSVLVGFLAVLLVSPLTLVDRKRRAATWIMRLWARTLMRVNPMWKVHVRGQENVDPRATYVITPNHQSHGDILLLGHVRNNYVYMAKEVLFRIPFIGWGMWMAGCIPIKRGQKDSARQAMARAEASLRRGVSLLIFPEGTRSPDGRVGAFKDGAFRLALQTGRDVLPVAIEGSRTALPKGSWLFTERSEMQVVILPPISVAGLDESHVDLLKERVRAAIEPQVYALAARRDAHV